MKSWVVFYAGMVFAEYEGQIRTRDIPDGAYAYNYKSGFWYSVTHHSLMSINKADVPKDLLVWLLIL